MNCVFSSISGKWQCINCGRIVPNPNKRDIPPTALCKAGNVYPSTINLAKNFGKAMLNYAKSGFKNVTTEQYKDRLKVCQGDDINNPCEHYDNGRCKHVDCGCFLSKKAWLATENCPIGKWPELKDEGSAEDKTKE